MRVTRVVGIAVGVLVLAGCGAEDPAARDRSGVTGRVILGPQCPVETLEQPCEDQPAADVPVTVSERVPGESYAAGSPVARTRTRADGSYRVAVPPGEYVVTAEAGMSCELMDVRVPKEQYARADIPCDTGIR